MLLAESLGGQNVVYMQKLNPAAMQSFTELLRGRVLWIFFNLCRFVVLFCFFFSICAAELQFAFICFLIGNVYDAFEHWKRLLNILCRSEVAVGKYQDLYTNLIFVLYHQLNEIPSDFFVDIVSQDNFLTSTLQVRL